MFDDHKYIEWFEKDSVNRREITGPDLMSVVLQESAPVLSTGSFSDSLDIFADGAFAHHNRQFEQLAMYLLGSPAGVLTSHLLDEFDGFPRDTRLAAFGCRFPFPIDPEELAMPAQNGIRLNKKESGLPEV